jgi:hypothetical protein
MPSVKFIAQVAIISVLTSVAVSKYAPKIGGR